MGAGTIMTTAKPRDFASMLDELLGERAEEPDRAHLFSIDYLSVVEELHSGRISFSDGVMHAAYQASLGEMPENPAEPEPSVDPDDIARELGLAGKPKVRELDRLRRDFAFRNHPDRVPEHLRARAIIRMQVANMLIDEAKRGRIKLKKA
jgi:hypothetical protein